MNINWMVDYDWVVKKEFTQDCKISYLEKSHMHQTLNHLVAKKHIFLELFIYNFLFLSYPEGKEQDLVDGWFKLSYKSIFGWDQ